MLIQDLISSDKYNIKCPYPMTPKGICIHNTANDASAKNEIAYMKSNNNEVSFHIAVDDIEAIQGIPFTRNAWATGDGGNGEGNRNYIQVEICYSKSGGERFIAAEKRAAKEVATLLKTYNWTISNIKKHQDFSNKYCPHRTLDLGWERFLNLVRAEMEVKDIPSSNNSTQNELYRIRKTWEDTKSQIGAFTNLDNAKKVCKLGYSIFNSKGEKVYSNDPVEIEEEYIIKKYAEKGVFTCTEEAINFRNNPIINANNLITGQYYRNETVNYDYVVITNKYVYISWISSTGIRRYMPVRDLITKEVWGTFK